ncbi:MAG: hypothetical protein OXI63_18065 [Candidatus Poribacteria bacterium]|nr:hypothetical protein [Candidatus Poribacteria bacterium]
MRAVVLSDSKIVKLLNKHYVNVFLLIRDLRELQKKTKDESVSRFANTISKTFEEAVARDVDGSVNSFVLSPQLDLIDHLPYEDLIKPNEVIDDTYLTFLKDALTKNNLTKKK